MKKVLITLFLFKVLSIHTLLFSALLEPKSPTNIYLELLDNLERDLKEQALEVLDTKCNICHRRQNPFKVFSLKNMNKHAAKIYEQVFLKQRMPKGDAIKLTEEEAQILIEWLKSQNIR
ncbi:MAG: hypothetical protein AAF694_13315 [Bacteroidota bacterium]